MADLIDNPVINSPFEEPKRHFRFDDNGITDEIVPGRRIPVGRTHGASDD
jgi:type III restriction enzyme